MKEQWGQPGQNGKRETFKRDRTKKSKEPKAKGK